MKIFKIFILASSLTILFFSFGSTFISEENAFRGPSGLALSPNGKLLYISEHEGKQIDIFSIQSSVMQKSIPLDDKPTKIFISKNDKLLVLQGEENGKLLIFDRKKLNKENETEVGHSPCGLTETDDNYIICNRFPGEISFISKKTLKTVKRIKVGREPIAIVSDKDKDLLYVAHHLPEMSVSDSVVASKITIINLKNQVIIKTILLPNGSNGLKDICLSSDGKYIFVTHILARFHLPTTQLERGWMNTNAISIIAVEKAELWRTVLLDDIDEGAANPWALGHSGNGKYLYVTHAGTNEVSIIDWEKLEDALNGSATAGTDYYAGDDLGLIYNFRKRVKLAGIGPRSLAVTGDKIIIANYFSNSISILDPKNLKEQSLHLEPGRLNNEQKGEMYFNDATTCFQKWQSCSSCHPDARVDGLNWDLLNDGIGNPKNTKSLLLSNETPPVMSLGIRSHAKLAVRAGFKNIQFSDIPEEYSLCVDAYLESLKPVRNPWNYTETECEPGKKLFQSLGCGTCHSGPYFTDLKSYSSGIDTVLKWDTPALVELWRTGPYWHNGSYSTLQELFESEKHGLNEPLTKQEIYALEIYLLSL